MNTKKHIKKLNPCLDKNKRLISRKLNNLCEYLNKEYLINYGGCCLITYFISKLLKKDNFKFKVIVWSDYCLSANNFTELNSSQFHYAISLGRYNINSDNCSRNTYLHRYVFNDVNPSDILKHYKRNKWNSTYNTSYNDLISKMLKMSYNAFTENLRKE